MAITLPKQINVGFVNRNDTYDGKLAYIIYYDEKGVLRKEKSWQTWRNKDIPNVICDNEPTDGFVLNKKAGGYSTGWNHRNTYIRVYDPRGFEFEITVPNLLYILENTNSIKGKGLEGKFVYGWDGTELLLIPVNSPDYAEINEYSKMLQQNQNIKAKDLIQGATYKSKDNRELVYIGKYDKYDYSYDYINRKNRQRRSYKKPYVSGKEFFFYDLKNDYITTIKTITNKLIYVVDENCASNYAYLVDKLDCSDSYVAYDYKMDEYVEYTLEELKEKAIKEDYWLHAYIKNGNDYDRINISKLYCNYKPEGYMDQLEVVNDDMNYRDNRKILKDATIEQIYEKFKPCYKRMYLSNGKLFKEEK